MPTKAEELIQLAQAEFIDLSIPESELLRKVVDGEEADYSTYEKICTLRASLIAWLCTDENACQFITNQGINIFGAVIEDSLNLSFATLSFPLIFRSCDFLETVRLNQAKLEFLDLSDSDVTSSGESEIIEASSIQVNEFIALEAINIQINGSIILRNTNMAGAVWLEGSSVGGNLICRDGTFDNPKGTALELKNAQIKGSVLLSYGFKASGIVSLYGASIGSLECHGGNFEAPEETEEGIFKGLEKLAIYAEGIKVRGSIFLRHGFKSAGVVWLSGAVVGGSLCCEDGTFSNFDDIAINAQNAQINENIYFCRGFNSIGEVNILGACIGGSLSCVGGAFQNIGGNAFAANNVQIGGDALLSKGFTAIGEVSLSGAKINGILDCEDGFFYNPRGKTIVAGNCTIAGSVYLSGNFYAVGLVNFIGSNISNIFELKIKQIPSNMILILSFMNIRTLSDSEDSWPLAGYLFIDGLTYERIDGKSPLDPISRLKWLRLQPKNEYSFQPYEQLAKVLRENGYEDSAKEILIAKQQDLREYREIKYFSRLQRFFLEHTIAYGYKPFRVLPWMGCFIAIGAFLFWMGYLGDPKLITPANKIDPFNTKPVESTELSEYYPRFNPIIYSLDTFIPIVNLRQQEYWLPNANRERVMKICSPARGEFIKIPIPLTGSFLRWYMWLHIVVGWILTSLFVAGLTGLVRRIN